MFRKLKKRFITLSMMMLTLVFIGIFGAIYLMTATGLERQTQFNMEKMMFAPPRPMPESGEAVRSLIIETDAKGTILSVFSYVMFEEDVIQNAVSKVISKTQQTGHVQIDSKSYAYLKAETPGGLKVVMVDRSQLQDTLTDLLMVFLWVGGGSMLVLFAISVVFANRAVRPIQEAFEKQQQFIADASHELRTPLTVIQTHVALLGENADETDAKWLSGIQTETENMSVLVTDMLDLAKLDHGVESVKVHTSIKKLVETCLLSYDAIFFEHGIEIETEMPQDVQVVCDPDALRRLLVILLDNAVKYTDQGGKVEVRLGTERHKKMVLSVRNTGEGIPEDRLDAIFDRFVRLEDSRAKESGGYGLGLAIARSIAGQQGGYLKATSLMGEWTQMTLTLPL